MSFCPDFVNYNCQFVPCETIDYKILCHAILSLNEMTNLCLHLKLKNDFPISKSQNYYKIDVLMKKQKKSQKSVVYSVKYTLNTHFI
jgi:hypothetical protein